MGLAAVTWLEFVAGVQSVAHGGNAGSRSRAAVGLGSPTGPQPAQPGLRTGPGVGPLEPRRDGLGN